MLDFLIEKKLLFPLILFVAVYAAIEISYYRGHAAGSAEEKERQEKVIQELKDKTIHFCNKFKDIMFSHIVDSLGYDVIEEQKFYNEKDKNTIYYITIDKQ